MKRTITLLILFTTLLSAERLRVKEVKTDPKEIRPFILLKKGVPYSSWKVYLSVRRIYSAGIYDNVWVEKEKHGDEIVLKFTAKPKEVIKGIREENPFKFHHPSFLYVRKGDYLEKDAVEKEIKRQEKFLRENGYFKGTVRYEIKKGYLIFKFLPGKRFKISHLSINGEKVKVFYDIKTGEYYSRRKIERAIFKAKERLKSQGFPAAEVNYSLSLGEGSVFLDFHIKKGKKFLIKIKGGKVPEEVIYPYWSRKYSRQWAIYEGKTAIKEYLLKKGMYVREIEGQVNEYPEEIEVVYVLRGVGKLKGKEIKVEGNHFLSEKEILRMLRGKPTLITGIDLEKLRESLVDLRERYLMQGFRDVSISWEIYPRGVKIKISEGRRFLIGNLIFEGNQRISSEKLVESAGIKPGDPYYSLNVYQAAQNLRNLYLKNGFRKFEITYKTVFKGNKADIYFRIKEGIKPVLSLFKIIGSASPRGRKLIREYLPFIQGKPVDGVAEDEGKLKLEVMGIFTQLEVKENIWDEHHLDIIVRAEQLPSYTYSFGAGWETRGGPRISLEFSTRNSILPPMFMNLSVLLGGSQRVVGLTSETPRMFRHWDFRSTAVYERGEMTSYSYETSSIYLSLFREKSMGWDQISLRISRVELTDLLVPQSEVDREFFPSYITSLSYFYALDRRDDPINPTMGWFFSSSFEKYFAVLGTKVDGAKTYIHLQIFRPMGQNLFGLGAKFGLAKGNLPISERFFAGGPMSFRGESLDRLSPTSPKTGMPLGGMGLAIVNLEYRIKLISGFSFVVFYDGGEVSRYMHELSIKKWENAVGVGLRYTTPFGPIRLEAGYNPNPAHGGKIKFFISLGEIL